MALDPYWPRVLAATKRQDPTFLPVLIEARRVGVAVELNGQGGLKFTPGSLGQQGYDQRFRPAVTPAIDSVIRPALILAAQMPHPWLDDLRAAYVDLWERREKGAKILMQRPTDLAVAARLLEVAGQAALLGDLLYEFFPDDLLLKNLAALYRHITQIAKHYPPLTSPVNLAAPARIEGQEVTIGPAGMVTVNEMYQMLLPPAESQIPLQKGA